MPVIHLSVCCCCPPFSKIFFSETAWPIKAKENIYMKRKPMFINNVANGQNIDYSGGKWPKASSTAVQGLYMY